jgi:acetyl-CoA carboxylase carboxyltransferase component
VNALQAHEEIRLMRQEEFVQVLFKQKHKTLEKAKDKRINKKKKMIETMRNHIHHVHTEKQSPIKKVLVEIKCQMQKIWLDRRHGENFSFHLL